MAVTDSALNDDVKTSKKPLLRDKTGAKTGGTKKAGSSKTPASTAKRAPAKRVTPPNAAPNKRAPATKSVGRLLAEVERERGRLAAAIAEAKELLSGYATAAEIRREKAAAEIGPLILAAHETLIEADREHLKTLTEIEAETDLKVAKILGLAREEAAIVRSATALATSGQPSKLISPPTELVDKPELVDKA